MKEGIIVSIETTEKNLHRYHKLNKGLWLEILNCGCSPEPSLTLPIAQDPLTAQPGSTSPFPSDAIGYWSPVSPQWQSQGDENLCRGAEQTLSPAVLLRETEISQINSISAGKAEGMTRSSCSRVFEEAGGEEAQLSSDQRQQQGPGLLSCLFILEREDWSHPRKIRRSLRALV